MLFESTCAAWGWRSGWRGGGVGVAWRVAQRGGDGRGLSGGGGGGIGGGRKGGGRLGGGGLGGGGRRLALACDMPSRSSRYAGTASFSSGASFSLCLLRRSLCCLIV